MEIRIRPATEADFDAVNRLRAQVNQLHVQGRPDIFKPGFGPALQRHLLAYLNSNVHETLVAEAEGQIAGFAMADFIVRPQSPYILVRSFYHVAEFGVDPAWQRKGVASALMKYMEADAQARGFSKIELDVWAFNQNAIAFYEAAGFQCYRRFMELPLRETRVSFPETWRDGDLKFAVIAARRRDQWVFCKHQDRDTWELPGGHREMGEAIDDTARRELYEETGALDYDLRPVCAYAVEREGTATLGMLYAADIRAFEGELHSEIEKITVTDSLPAAWTYPDIQPKLLAEIENRGLGPAPAKGGVIHLICGRICSGKSTFAKRLAQEKRAVILSSDDLTQPIGDHDRVYPIVHEFMVKKALEIAACGGDVILDWGFWHRKDREAITARIGEAHLRCRWYYMDMPEETLRAHAEKRNAAPGPGDFYVDEGLMEKCRAQFEPPLPGEMDHILRPGWEQSP